MKNKKYYFIVFILSFIISIVIAPLRSGAIIIGPLGGFKLSSIIGFVVYFLFTFYFLKNKKEQIPNIHIVLAILIGISLLNLPLRIIDFSETHISLLEYLIHLSSVLLAWVFYRISTKHYKVLILMFSLCFCVLSSTIGYDLWLNKINFGTFSGRVDNANNYEKFLMQNIEGETLGLFTFKGKYLLVDCWNTNCGVCYQEMPKVQELYNKYDGNSGIQIYTLHARIEDRKETYSTGVEILKKRGYNLPVLSINIEDQNLKDVGVVVYPTVLVFDKESKLIYRGDIEGAGDLLDELLVNDRKNL